MTDKILSQDEVDTLLKGVAAGEVDTEKADDIPPGLKPYDFTRKEGIACGRMPGLDIANERFSRLCKNSVSTLLMRTVDVSVEGAAIVKMSDFLKSIPMPSSINIFKMEPLKGYSLFVMETSLIYALIEFFFGSTEAKHIKSEGKQFTSIEQKVIQRMVTIALNDLASAWNGITTIQPEYVSSEVNPEFVTVFAPTEIALKIEFRMEIADFSGKLFFCIPYSKLEPVKEKLYSGIYTDKSELDSRWNALLKELLLDSHSKLTAELGKTEVTFGDLMNLEVGSVISLDKSTSDELVVRIEDVSRFEGLPCFYRGNQAIKLTKVIG